MIKWNIELLAAIEPCTFLLFGVIIQVENVVLIFVIRNVIGTTVGLSAIRIKLKTMRDSFFFLSKVKDI